MEFETENHANDRRREYIRKNVNKLHILMLLGMIFYITSSGTIYGYTAFAIVMMIALRSDIPFRDVVGFRRKIGISTFVILLFFSQIIHPFLIISEEILSQIFASFGMHINTTREFLLDLENGYEPTPLPDIIMSGFVAPLFEETICRGYIAGSYHRITGSKIHAILFSGIIFGIMHCEIGSLVPFSIGGFVFAYVALEYGILWSMIYHSFTNFMIGEVLCQRIIINFPAESRFPIYCGLSAFIAIVCMIVLFIKRRDIMEYINENACEKEDVKTTALSLPFIIFIVLMFIFMFNRIRTA